MAFFSRRLYFLTHALKNYRELSDLFMGEKVSAFGNGGMSGNRHNRAGARWAPFCAAANIGF
jgi:hypothetical protein